MRSAPALGSVLRVTPAWLRPGVMVLVAVVHAGVIFGVPWQKPDDLVVPVTLQLDVVAGGEPAHAEQAVDAKQSDEAVGEVKPVETQPAEVKTAADVAPQEVAEAKPVQQPSPAPAPTAETAPSPPEAQQLVPAEQVPAPTVSRNALAMTTPTIKSEEQRPDAPAATEPPRPQHSAPDARDIQREQKRKEQEKLKEQAEKRKEQAEKIKHNQAAALARLASRAGTETGRGETGAATGAISTADYSSLVNAEIRRHSHYPESASPATGTVLLSFTIGPAGRVTSSSVVQSSGHGEFDSAARQTLSALSLPPPPGGHFSRTVQLHFRPG